jgi:hypothetical protein
MTKPNDEKNVRRLGKGDQKNQLPRAGSLFPAEEPTPEPAASGLNLDALALPDPDAGALEAIQAMQEAFRAPIITPDAERYPPLAPAAPDQPVRKTSISIPQADQPATAAGKSAGFYHFVTLVALIGTVASIIWIALIWVDPQSAVNPFPPATPFIQVTATPAGAVQQIAATPDASGQIFVVITDTPPAITRSAFAFSVRDAVTYLPNANDFGCEWWSIAGSVTDLNGNAVNGLRVQISGQGINETIFSGTAQTFGAGGFELPLIGTPQQADFSVQLFSAQQEALSDPFTVRTRSDCEGNVVVVNFVENR